MKITIYILSIIVSTAMFGLERPDNVPSKITELRTKDWYQQASLTWKEYLNDNPDDTQGWIDYFNASSFAGQSHTNLELILKQVTELHPNSFVSEYLSFKVHGWSSEGINYLRNAYNQDKTNIQALEDYLVFADLTREVRRELISTQVFEKGLIHSSTLNYNYNLLMSVSENGILVTDAIHTTIPLWVLQDVMGVRKDISILNLSLVRNNKSYVESILGEKNLNFRAEDLLSQTNDVEVFYALTIPRQRLQNIENRLFVVGLASTNGDKDFNHFEILRENIEEKFLIDYLSIDFNGEPKTATGNVLSSNYIVPFLLLKEFYDKVDDAEKSEKIKDQILALANDSQIKTRVELLLNTQTSPRTFKVIDLDTKSIDRGMKQVKNSIYASKTELKNGDFWVFMEYLRSNGYNDLYKNSLVDISDYDDLKKAMLNNYHYSPELVQSIKRDKGGNYFDYPVLELKHSTSQAYCEWLTVQYNAQPKRKFKKVVFRLPTKEEWIMAALGYRNFQSWKLAENTIEAQTNGTGKMDTYNLENQTVSYPWYTKYWELRNSILNNKDCYLANVRTSEQIVCAGGIKGDGYTFASPVGTYFPNGLGLYDVIGNAAEMINEPGVAMGGSWNLEAENSTITSEFAYDVTNIGVGFRLFMEVIEE